MVGEVNAVGRSTRPAPLGDDAAYNAAVATFIRAKGITRCPTACVAATQATIGPVDREALQWRWAETETRRLVRGDCSGLMLISPEPKPAASGLAI